MLFVFFFFQAEDGIRDYKVTGVQTCALPISFLIFYEAFRRLQNPQQIHASVMIGVAAAGVVMNGVIAVLLYRTSQDVNIRSALRSEERRVGKEGRSRW